MPYFDNEGVKIYYEIEGEGPPVVMIHGFPANLERWKETNWVTTLKKGYQLILLDCRGHGKSDKPHDESYYGQKMTDDVVNLMEHLSIDKANFLGYSMGAYITFRLLLSNPSLFISAILGGFILGRVFLNFMQDDKERSNAIENMKHRIEAFKADSIKDVKDPIGRAFRRRAELKGNDLTALAAVTASFLKERIETMKSPTQIRESLKEIKVPVMTVIASGETLSGKTLVAQLVLDACHFQIQGKDHFNVLPDPKFKMIVKAFLNFVNNE
ncbi:MAG: alpha/beta fold hydrolase [Candidatus Hodarchaeota archaeon]